MQVRPEKSSCFKIQLKDKTFFAALAETCRLEELRVGNQFGNLFDGLNTAIYAHIRRNVPWQFEPLAAPNPSEK
jgi:hypothetical protein